jgi:hypothetical protein
MNFDILKRWEATHLPKPQAVRDETPFTVKQFNAAMHYVMGKTSPDILTQYQTDPVVNFMAHAMMQLLRRESTP